ncbi:MAG: leucyl/phenylalanyl-tRNA--protein transferase [Alphaproteobacteria bacterium]|nr:leucyl/phenylalanyl-tRNA--protein transferase [Alphaproteobacteria bacterium]
MRPLKPQRYRLTPELLLDAYRHGLFPMAEDRHDPRLYWIEPELRGVIPLDDFHVPKRLARTVKQGTFAVRIDCAFGGVIEACARPAPGRWTTWINDEIIELYTRLHAMGHAHSVECWQGDRLVGGLYGIAIDGAFFGESMFSTETDSSKVALVHLVARLKAGGFRLLDAQFVTKHLARFGAFEVPRSIYKAMLAEALAAPADFYRFSAGARPADVLQAITRKS